MLGLTFRQLQVFVEVADLGSFRTCAERLGVTQVSVSGHIRAMERILGLPLFDRRRGRASVLTDDGKRVYPHAVVLLRGIQELMDEMGSAGRTVPRRRLIITGHGYVSYRLAHIFAEFGQRFPEWQVEVEPNDQKSALELVESGKADLGFVLSLEGDSPSDWPIVWRERLGLYVGRDHPLASSAAPSMAELSAQPLINLPRKDGLHDVIGRALKHQGIAGNPTAMQTANANLALQTVMQGTAMGCFFSHLVVAEAEAGRLVELPVRLSAVEIVLVSSDHAHARRAARAILDMSGRIALT